MPTFDDAPTPQRLTPFAHNSLRQDLPHGVRLWVILASLYSDVEELKTLTDW